ncbi:hypothetical protein A1QO_02500 [Vibrio genomosp. F10 str. ZF-129]|uniref:Uncharacterized protein n=1 Tax=Vibrio genomosp. F10 str. ZF-129 TaxID=1187848 RepID=A0A1E5BK69_9VIBR|nr:hypothetical protein [Vibrio genomosp. F10]OEE38267.1 hypothetical protein A1QO_02500 [Vibrio genomosp. F10 str. ZF-129]
MLKVTHVKRTDSHVLTIIGGLTVGFDATERHDGFVALCYEENIVASLEGELLELFERDDYVVENHLMPN